MQHLAVVPIFVNAGAALLPAIIAALTSLIALILSPRAMFNLVRRKPWLPILILALCVALYYTPHLFPNITNTTNITNNSLDWPSIARELQRQNQSSLLTPLWNHNLDNEAALSTPAIFTSPEGQSILYLPTTLFEPAKQFGNLFAFDISPNSVGGGGKLLWKATTPTNDEFDTNYFKPFFSSPAISPDGSRLVVGQGLHEDANCPLLCFSGLRTQDSGLTPRLAWSLPTPLHVESSPAIFTQNGQQLVVVGAGAIEGNDRLAIGNPGYVFCADLLTGKQLWQFPLNDPESSPAVDENGIIYIGSGFNGNAIVALHWEPDAALKTPRQLWRTPTPHPALGNPLLASDPTLGNLLLIGIGNGDFVYSDPHPAGLILALNRATGKILWQTPLPDSAPGRLAIAKLSAASGQQSEKASTPSTDHQPLTTDHSILLTGCRDGQAYALNLNTGKILWHTTISTTPNTPVLAGLVADNQHAYALAVDGTLAILALSDGQLLERQQLSDPAKSPLDLCFSTPLLHDHILYVATETTGLHAFRINQNP